jgi:hypothetical protein
MFLGTDALVNNTTGGLNTATGSDALTNNISGIASTAVGANSLKSTVYSAINDTAVGYEVAPLPQRVLRTRSSRWRT